MLYGLSFIRNGHKYDYPFVESLQGLSELCENVYLTIGNSEDGTEKTIKEKFPSFITTNTIWNEKSRTGGYILSEQTNITLNLLRENQKDGWAFYLQGDEILHENDFATIKSDIIKAENNGCDTISFRYFHFWQRYDKIAIKPNWYPQEIRAIKINSNILSYGDAQSFKNHTKTYESDAFIYHYGHVRNEEQYRLKMHDFHKLWHPDNEVKKIEERDRKREDKEPVLNFLGGHPKYINDKIEKLNGPAQIKENVYIYLESGKLSDEFRENICVKNVFVINNKKELKTIPKEQIISISDSFIDKLIFKSNVPKKMRSKHARIWNLETLIKLKLSEKGYWVK